MTANAPYVSSRPGITLNGSANADMVKALLDVTVRAPEAGMTSAEIRLVNWGDKPDKPVTFMFDTVSVGDKIEIAFGLAQQKTVFKGDITGIEERYGEGAPQIVLLAEDALHKLARHREQRVFEQKSPNDIVNTLATDVGLKADVKLSDTPGTYHQLNESNLHFLRRLAARYAVTPRCVDGTLICRERETLPTPVALDAGDTLKRLRVVADLNRQPAQVKVTGYDLAAASPADSTATKLLVPANGPTAAAALGKLGWDGNEIYAFAAPATQDEAADYASAAFDAMARRFLHGDIVCTGNPDVWVGGAVALSGVSQRLSGNYAVVACAHLFDETAGYQTYARIERPDSG